MLKQKFLLGERALFPIFWKKIEKNLEKNFQFFLFTKICFSGLEKVYVQLLVLNFFSDFGLQKIIFGNFEEFGLFFEVFQLLDKKKFKTKSCTYAFSSSEKQILVKKKFFFENFFQIFFIFFPKHGKKCHFPQRKFLFQHSPDLIYNSGPFDFDLRSAGEKKFS